MAIRKIVSRSITDGAVVATDVADLSVDSTKLASSAVTNAKIAAGAISTDKLDSTAVRSGMKNRIINGAMVIDQRNAGASVTPSNTQYVLDRYINNLSQTSKLTVQQSTTAPSGFSNSMLVTSSSAYSVLSSDYFQFEQRIEGFNFSDMAWGTANAQTITLSFQVRSSLTGTFGGSLRNNAGDRSYPFTYTINSANTFETKTITIVGDTTGTWIGSTNGIAVRVGFGLGVGSTYSGTAGSWAGANYLSSTGATSVVGTSGATFYITGVQLELGSSATGYEYRQYQQELALCQRYYFKMSGAQFSGFGSGYYRSTTTAWACVKYPITMRTAPTATQANTQLDDSASNTAVTGIGTSYYNADAVMLGLTVASGGTQFRPVTWGSNNATTGYVDFSAEL